MTEPDSHLPPQLEADVVALADGNLSPDRRAELEALVAREPAVAAALARQRSALALLSGLDTPAPLELRLRVEELKARRRRLHRRRWLPAAFLATASATVALVLVVVVGGGPAVEDVFALGARPATAPAATDEQVDGLAFPRPKGWQAIGARRDVVGGRETRTVFYEKAGRRIAYTIVSGPALAEGDRVLAAGGRRAYSWPRDGRTCVISGAVPEGVLHAAAQWR
jgi:anti-sigma factor RsiW